MRLLRFLCILSFAVTISACLGINTSNNAINAPSAASPESIVPQGEIILAITNDFQGMSWMKGEILDFRMYSSGEIEFDDYPTEPSNSSILVAEEVKVRKQYRVSPEIVSDFRSIVLGKDFIRLKDTYEKLSPSCDAISNKTVTAGRKIINIPQWCGRQEPPEFPAELIALFRKIRELKKEKLGKELPTP